MLIGPEPYDEWIAWIHTLAAASPPRPQPLVEARPHPGPLLKRVNPRAYPDAVRLEALRLRADGMTFAAIVRAMADRGTPVPLNTVQRWASILRKPANG